MAERTYRALLIANWEFPDDTRGLPALRGPRVDAELMRAALTNPRTGLHRAEDVHLVTDTRKQEVMVRLEDFYRDANRDDQLLLYYSGHGQLDLAGRLYLCTRDSRIDRLMATAVHTRDISDLMDESRARAKVVVLDCCHSGGFKSGADLPQGLAGRGRFVLSSSLTSELTKDAEDEAIASPFTRFVAEVLSSGEPDHDRDGYVSVEDLYRHVSDRMRDAGLSTPQRRFDDAVASVAVARAPTTITISEPAKVRSPASAPALPVDHDAVLAEFFQADSFERRGRPWLAKPLYRHVAAAGLGDWSTFAALRQARLAADPNHPDEAKTAYQQVIAAAHQEWSAEAAYLLAQFLTDDDEAERAYRAATELAHPTWSPLAALKLAERIMARTPVQDSLALVRPHLDHARSAKDPSIAARAAFLLGSLHDARQESAAARANYRRAVLTADPEWSARAAIALSESYERINNFRSARDACRLALTSDLPDVVTDARNRLLRLDAPPSSQSQ